MRYTTIIDISQMPAVYRCQAAVSIYLHLCLKSGYHDNDRDRYECSIRQFGYDLGLTLSAVRHGLEVLMTAGLLKREDRTWIVTKWVMDDTISARPKQKRQSKAERIAQEMREEDQRRNELADRERERREEMAAQGKSDYIVYYERLAEQAKQGDKEAAAAMKRHKPMYEAALRNMAR